MLVSFIHTVFLPFKVFWTTKLLRSATALSFRVSCVLFTLNWNRFGFWSVLSDTSRWTKIELSGKCLVSLYDFLWRKVHCSSKNLRLKWNSKLTLVIWAFSSFESQIFEATAGQRACRYNTYSVRCEKARIVSMAATCQLQYIQKEMRTVIVHARLRWKTYFGLNIFLFEEDLWLFRFRINDNGNVAEVFPWRGSASSRLCRCNEVTTSDIVTRRLWALARWSVLHFLFASSPQSMFYVFWYLLFCSTVGVSITCSSSLSLSIYLKIEHVFVIMFWQSKELLCPIVLDSWIVRNPSCQTWLGKHKLMHVLFRSQKASLSCVPDNHRTRCFDYLSTCTGS